MTATEFETRATARRAWKDGVNIAGQGVSWAEEVGDAQTLVDTVLPMLTDRERARRDQDLRRAAEETARDLRAGKDLVDDPGAQSAYRDALTRAAAHDERVRRFESIEAEARATLHVAVHSEPRVYSKDSPNSYFRDLALSSIPGLQGHNEARDRLDRHKVEVGAEIRSGSKEGRAAVRQFREQRRGSVDTATQLDREVRAMSTGSGSGGAFVTPTYLVEDTSVYRTFESTFWDQTNKQKLPEYGLTAYLPALTSAASVGVQAGENTAVPNSSPSATYLSAPLVPQIGEIDVSQQLYDRGGPGMSTDQILWAQLTNQLQTAIDAYLLTQAIVGAGTVTDATTTAPTVAQNLWADVGTAQGQMETAPGVVAAPTHLFVPPTLYSWLSSRVDTAGRPVFTPTPANAASPIMSGPDGGPPAGYTGFEMLGNAVFRDGSIPTTGGNATLVLANMSEVHSFTGAPVLRAIPETLAGNLTVVIQAYAYTGLIVRYAKVIQTISGARYPLAPTF